jgi:hypothetical protein
MLLANWVDTASNNSAVRQAHGSPLLKPPCVVATSPLAREEETMCDLLPRSLELTWLLYSTSIRSGGSPHIRFVIVTGGAVVRHLRLVDGAVPATPFMVLLGLPPVIVTNVAFAVFAQSLR